MPDLVAHYVASYLISRPILKRRLYAALIAFAGLLPDVDAALRLHRWATHSLLTLLAPIAIYLALRIAGRKRLAKIALLATTLYALHIAMDLFTAPTPILWPALTKSVWVKLSVVGIATRNTLAIEPHIQIQLTQTNFTPHPIEGPILALPGTTLLITCIAIEAMHYLMHRKSNP